MSAGQHPASRTRQANAGPGSAKRAHDPREHDTTADARPPRRTRQARTGRVRLDARCGRDAPQHNGCKPRSNGRLRLEHAGRTSPAEYGGGAMADRSLRTQQRATDSRAVRVRLDYGTCQTHLRRGRDYRHDIDALAYVGHTARQQDTDCMRAPLTVRLTRACALQPIYRRAK